MHTIVEPPMTSYRRPPPLGSVLVRLLRLIHRWCERSRQRRQLARLNDHALKDIGLTRIDVRTELGKPFWHP